LENIDIGNEVDLPQSG